MRTLWLGLALAASIALSGAVAAADNEYHATTNNVDAGTWDRDGSVIVQPDTVNADITVTVNKGVAAGDKAISMTGGLVVSAENAGAGDDRNASIVFTAGASGGDNTRVDFAGGVTLTGTDEKSASLTISSDAAKAITHIRTTGATEIGTNATLTVTGSNAYYTSFGDIVINDVRTDPDDPSTGGLVVNGGTIRVRSAVEDEDAVLRLNKGRILVANGTLLVDNFVMGDDSATDETDTVTIQSGGSFIVEKYSGDPSDPSYPDPPWQTGEASINRGTFTVEAGGEVVFMGGAVLDKGATMNLLTEHAVLGDDTAITIQGDADAGFATLNIGDGTALNVAIGGTNATIDNKSGILNITENATLYVPIIISNATTHVAEGATARTAQFTVTGGTTTVDGEISDLVAGEGVLRVSDGIAQINDKAVISINRFVVSGGEANIRGTLAEGINFSATGGVTTITTSAVMGDGAGLNSFSVGGYGADGGVVNLQAKVRLELPETTDFSLDAGRINLAESSLLMVREQSDNLFGGSIVYEGANAKVEFHGKTEFAGGGIVSRNTGSVLDMHAQELSITKSAVLDTREGELVIENAAGLTLSGTYRPGATHYGMIMATLLTGGGGYFNVIDNDYLKIDLEGIEETIHNGLASGDVLILETDITDASASDLLKWAGELNEDTYYFETRLDPTTGTIGLYVTGFAQLSEEDRYTRMIGDWNPHPRVKGNAEKLINRTLNRAITQARRLQTTAYSTLSRDGQFNADVLVSLARPSERADYDSLMLYNGSGLGTVTQAILNSTGQTIKQLAMRNTYVRHELHAAGETFGAGSARASEYLNECLSQRLWITGHYTSDTMSWDEGFAGYSYQAKGLMLGYDRLCGNFTIGGAFSYLGGDFDDAASMDSNSTIDTFGFHVYSGYSHPSGFYLTAAAGYAYSDNQIRDQRKLYGAVGWNRADYHSNTYMIAASMGFDWRPAEYFVITPSIGISYQTSKTSEHEQYFSSEDGATSAMTLKPGSIENYSTTLPLDIAVRYDLFGDEHSLLSITGNIGYAYEFNNTGAEGYIAYGGLEGIPRVKIVSRHPGRHLVNVGVGAKYIQGPFEFSLNYDYFGRTKYNSHALTGTFSYSF